MSSPRVLCSPARADIPEFKATPFSSRAEAGGERFNLWPLAYADGSRGSALLNLFSWSDEHLALHPFYARYGDDSVNSLFGLFHWDLKGRDHWLFPFFFGRDEDESPYFSCALLWSAHAGWFCSWLYCQESDAIIVPPLLTIWDDERAISFPLLTEWNIRSNTVTSLWYTRTENEHQFPIILSHCGPNDGFLLLVLTWWNGAGGMSVPILTTWSAGGVRCLPLLTFHTDAGVSGLSDERDFVLGGLYYRRRQETAAGTYRRHAFLWKVWDWREETDGRVRLDCLPGVSYDRAPDGLSSFSFLWRFFRHARGSDGRRKLDLLYVPILR